MSKLKFESTVKIVPHSQQVVYNKLSDLKNIELLKETMKDKKIPDKLPDGIDVEKLDQVKTYLEKMTFTSDDMQVDTPIGAMTLKIIERTEPKCVKCELIGAPIAVTIWIQLVSNSENDSKMRVTVQSEVNMFMKSMVKKPLEQAAEQIAQVLSVLPYGL